MDVWVAHVHIGGQFADDCEWDDYFVFFNEANAETFKKQRQSTGCTVTIEESRLCTSVEDALQFA